MSSDLDSPIFSFLAHKTATNSEEITELILNPNYKTITIPKSNNKKRVLEVPEDKLKRFQQLLLENFLYQIPVSSQAHCSVPKRSVVTNASKHTFSEYFFRLDFQNAFPSTSADMVINELVKSFEKYQLTEIKSFDFLRLACFIAYLTTYKNHLPQGAPTSPYLLNIVCNRLDNDFTQIAKHCRLIYTRYMDDLYFSSKHPILYSTQKTIIKTIQDYGYKINEDKTNYTQVSEHFQPKITGIRISNTGVNVGKAEIENYRNLIHKAITDLSIEEGKIFGIIGWILMVEKSIPLRLQKSFKAFLTTRCPKQLPKYQKYLNNSDQIDNRCQNI